MNAKTIATYSNRYALKDLYRKPKYVVHIRQQKELSNGTVVVDGHSPHLFASKVTLERGLQFSVSRVRNKAHKYFVGIALLVLHSAPLYVPSWLGREL